MTKDISPLLIPVFAGTLILLILGGIFIYYSWFSQIKPQCTKNEDCGINSCQQGREKCVEIKYICERGKCIFPAKAQEFPTPPYRCWNGKCREGIPESLYNECRFDHKEEKCKEIEEILKGVSGEKEEVKPTEEKPSEEITNWKTYRNEDFGFEFRYPKDWQVINEAKYQRAACSDPEYRERDPTCGKHPLVSLGKEEKILISINLRQCLNVFELPNNHYICFDPALPPDKRGNYLDTTGKRTKYLDSEVQKGIYMIKNTFQILE